MDYVLLPATLLPRLHELLVFAPTDDSALVSPSTADSDHLPLLFRLQLPTPPPLPPTEPRCRYDSRKAERYARAVQAQLFQPTLQQTLDTSTADVTASTLQTVLLDCATRVYGVAKPRPPRPHSAAWFDTDCRTLRTELRTAERRRLPDARIRELRRSYRHLCASKKAAHRLSEGQRLEALSRRDPRAFYRALAPRPYQTPAAPPDALYAAFRALFDLPPPADVQPLPVTAGLTPDSVATLGADITPSEVLAALRTLRRNRAADLCGLRAEHLKDAAHPLLPYLTRLLNRFLDEPFPPHLARAELIPLPKKGDPTDANNYRGIACISILSKLHATLLSQRLTQAFEKSGVRARGQAGFRPGHSTTDQIYLLHSAIQDAQRTHRPLYACFVDFRKAFDSVPRELLWSRLRSLSVPDRLIAAIVSYYDNVEFTVRHDEQRRFFPSTMGVKQGCPLSPILFGIFIDYFEEFVSAHPLTEHLVRRSPNAIRLLLYADDIVLLEFDSVRLQRLLDVLADFCRETHMSVNMEKTKIVVFRNREDDWPCKPPRSWHPQNHRFFVPPPSHWEYDGARLEVVDQYCYLGLDFHAWLPIVTHSLPTLISRANQATQLLLQRIRRLGLPRLSTCFRLFESYVCSRLLYACEVWLPWVRNPHLFYTHALDGVHRNFLKSLLGLPYSAATSSLMWECGRLPLLSQGLRRLLMFHNRALSLPADCLLRIHYVADLALPAHPLRQFLQSLSLPADIHAPIPVLPLATLYRESCLAHLQSKHDLADLFLGRKFAGYAHWHSPFGYLPLATDADPRLTLADKSRLCRFRLGCFPLPIEVGARARPRLPRWRRFCPHCPTEVGHEDHFLFHCPRLAPLRFEFYSLPFFTRDRSTLAATPFELSVFLRKALNLYGP